MNKNKCADSNIDGLLFLLLEDALDNEGIDRVERWLAAKDEHKRYYLNFVKDYVAMKNHAVGMIDMEDETVSIHDEYDAELWSALAEVERVAESIPQKKNVLPQERPLIQKVERQKVLKLNKSSLVTILLSAAALLFLVLFIRISPEPKIEVATLESSLNAVFADNPSYRAGSRLTNTDELLWLQEGAITVVFDYGAKVIIEAPAAFYLNSPEDMTLHYGRLYAQVPGRSKGFTVETPMAQVIDLGTEFGIKVDYDQSCEVHMIKGKASLIPGVKGQTTGDSRILNANQAEHIDVSGEVTAIPVKTTEFIRRIDPETGAVWRGHDRLMLADLIGGGNGFGTGKLEHGINPQTGVTGYRDRNRTNVASFQGFTQVKDNPYIDGVFCPVEDAVSVQVSSQGHVFEACPLTTGTYWGYVMNSGWFGQTGLAEGSFNGNLELAGQVYGSKEFPAITMHSNLGVTFDLDAIRQSIGHLSIQRFTARCGISDLVLEKGETDIIPKASFYVLLDGQKQSEHVDMTPSDGAADIRLDVPDEVRFLSLMVTEGSDRTYDGDWTLFAEPMLHLVNPND